MKTIRNIPHVLLPVVRDVSDQLLLMRNVKSASDHIKLLKAAKDNIFLLEQYLLTLDEEAKQNGIEKA